MKTTICLVVKQESVYADFETKRSDKLTYQHADIDIYVRKDVNVKRVNWARVDHAALVAAQSMNINCSSLRRVDWHPSPKKPSKIMSEAHALTKLMF